MKCNNPKCGVKITCDEYWENGNVFCSERCRNNFFHITHDGHTQSQTSYYGDNVDIGEVSMGFKPYVGDMGFK